MCSTAQISVVSNVPSPVSSVTSDVSNVVITGLFSHSVTNDGLIQQWIGYLLRFPSATPVVSNTQPEGRLSYIV